ncbi:hypothetical protein FM112_12710 [Gulosibacter sp. 10]|nr:hypothetical protein FM112_12710 [Gulosibacter sp. 10]
MLGGLSRRPTRFHGPRHPPGPRRRASRSRRPIPRHPLRPARHARNPLLCGVAALRKLFSWCVRGSLRTTPRTNRNPADLGAGKRSWAALSRVLRY